MSIVVQNFISSDAKSKLASFDTMAHVHITYISMAAVS